MKLTMKPCLNKINIPLLIIAVGLLAYFLFDLASILSGVAIISVPMYLLYTYIGILALLVLSLYTSIKARIRGVVTKLLQEVLIK